MKEQKWDAAAKAFIAIVDGNPKGQDSDKALNNAAVCYEKSKRFDSAVRIYERIWQQYPNSEFADEALWRTAINYQRGFEFTKAVNNFLILADSPKFANSSHRTDSIYNAAVILENDQDYRRSAKLFIRYASAKGGTKEGADAYFRAGEIYEKMGDYGAMVRIFRDFPTRYGSVPKQATRIVEGLFKIGKGAQKRNDWRTTRKYYRLTISEFSMRGLPPASDAAEYAANAAFELIEPDMQAFLAKTIKGAISTLLRKENQMAVEAKKLYDRYKDIWKYKRARWTLASMYRHGQIYEHFGRIMNDAYRKAPIPRKVKKLGPEAEDIYRTQVDELITKRVDPISNRAQELYKACVDRAKQMGASNKYTEGAHRKLAAFDPINYPLLKRARVEYSLD
jgi:TolA-binding protein